MVPAVVLLISLLMLIYSLPRVLRAWHLRDCQLVYGSTERPAADETLLVVAQVWGGVLLLINAIDLIRRGDAVVEQIDRIVVELLLAGSAALWVQFPLAGYCFTVCSTLSWYPIFMCFMHSSQGQLLQNIFSLQWMGAFLAATAGVLTGACRLQRIVQPAHYILLTGALSVFAIAVPAFCKSLMIHHAATFQSLLSPMHIEIVEQWLQSAHDPPLRLQGMQSAEEQHFFITMLSMTLAHGLYYFVIQLGGDGGSSPRPVEASAAPEHERQLHQTERGEDSNHVNGEYDQRELPADLVEITEEEAIALQQGKIKPSYISRDKFD